MDDNKQTYYISIGPGEILTVPNASPWQFKIEATQSEIKQLRRLFNANIDNRSDETIRAITPIQEYHNDAPNDRYDGNLVKIYEMIHQLGDEEARSHIEGMGILQNFTSE